MRAVIIYAAIGLIVGSTAQNITTGRLGDAARITNNPPGASYVAAFEGPVTGEVTATSAAGGKGVLFTVTVNGLPTEGGPFAYHIHDQPVPSDGNCNGTLAHLDPYQRGQTPPCDAAMPQTCEVGDLSGKYGKLEGHTNLISFTDNYAALVPGIGAFFGNRSMVLHFANSTRLACANFTAVAATDDGCDV